MYRYTHKYSIVHCQHACISQTGITPLQIFWISAKKTTEPRAATSLVTIAEGKVVPTRNGSVGPCHVGENWVRVKVHVECRERTYTSSIQLLTNWEPCNVFNVYMLRPTAMGNMNSANPRSIFKTDQKRSNKYRFDTSGTSHQTFTPGIPGSPVISLNNVLLIKIEGPVTGIPSIIIAPCSWAKQAPLYINQPTNGKRTSMISLSLSLGLFFLLVTCNAHPVFASYPGWRHRKKSSGIFIPPGQIETL